MFCGYLEVGKIGQPAVLCPREVEIGEAWGAEGAIPLHGKNVRYGKTQMSEPGEAAQQVRLCQVLWS